MKNRNILILIMIIVFGVACTACGKEEGGDNQNASGSSVSGSSAAGASASASPDSAADSSKEIVKRLDIELEKNQKHFFANKTSYFMPIWNEAGEETGFEQMVRSSGERTEFKPDQFSTLLGVTEEGVYYAKKEEESPDTAVLYRIPFRDGKGGKTKLALEYEEVVLEEPNGFVLSQPAYIDSHYIVYQPVTDCIIKYDRKSKEKTELPTISNTNSIVAVGKNTLIFADLTNNDEFLYRLDLDSDKLEEVWVDKKAPLDDVMMMHSDYLFCVRGNNLWAYDVGKGKREKLVSKEQLLEACDQAVEMTEGQKVKEAHIEKMFSYNRQLYVQVQTDWISGKDEKMGYVMFRMDFSKEERELVYEVSLSVCMRSRSAEQTHPITQTIKWNSGRCHDITEDGRVILILNRKETTEQQLACFNIRSREFKPISKEDKEYFIPYMDSKQAFGNDDFELEKSYMMLMPDDMF